MLGWIVHAGSIFIDFEMCMTMLLSAFSFVHLSCVVPFTYEVFQDRPLRLWHVQDPFVSCVAVRGPKGKLIRRSPLVHRCTSAGNWLMQS